MDAVKMSRDEPQATLRSDGAAFRPALGGSIVSRASLEKGNPTRVHILGKKALRVWGKPPSFRAPHAPHSRTPTAAASNPPTPISARGGLDPTCKKASVP